ncbi:MAG TPA: family 20 glycosylhydrolase [Steroidobacteraceae bacterium]
MRTRRAAAQAVALAVTLASPAAARSGVIPLPAEVVSGPGSFSVDSTTRLSVPRGDRDADGAARYLVELWTRTNGLTLPISTGQLPIRSGAASIDTANTNTIAFRHQRGFGPEGYELEITPQRITVSASSAAGLFYGAVTLWQLLPPGVNTAQIPAQTIRDAPAYAWRGLMLDSARHFQSPAFIRSMIDWMAWHKLNVLHWHLTDDQGWRLEIRKYPRLTSVGAWRIDPDGTRYGGFYTQTEVRDIVRFAATRHVQIVPEIEMPGHATAAVAAYPSVGAARGGALRVSASWGVHTHLFNLEPHTFGFLEDVLAEVIELFPSPTIHIGGDEAVKDEWNASPEVQARARELGIRDSEALQAYFTQRIGRYVAAHGRRIIGWDEILQPGLDKTAIVMSWHGVSGAHSAALAGNDTILAPWPMLYFDNRQSALPTEPPGRLKVVSLEDLYGFEPHDAALSGSQRRHVLGIQANLWTEHIQTEERVQWMALPRAAAVAEVGWSAPQRRRWPDFLERLVPMFARYRALGLNYADSVFAPAAQISRNAGSYTVSLSNQAGAAAPGEIRFTLDGSEPSAQSARYGTPLTVPAGTEVRAAAFAGAEQVSRTWTKRFDALAALRRDSHDLELCSDAIGLLLEPGDRGDAAGARAAYAPLAVDIMNPCWIDRGVDLSGGPRIVAAVAPLPFNYELGADAAKIRVGDARSAEGELEIHADACDTPALALVPLAPAASGRGVTTLAAQRLPRLPGRHDLCLRFARPRLDPLWAIDWLEVGE